MTRKATTPNVRFNLKSHRDDKKPVLLIAVFRYSSGRLLYTTGQKVLPKYWSKSRNRAYARLSSSDNGLLIESLDKVNKKLDKIEQKIIKIYEKNKTISKEEFKLKLDYALKRKEKPKSKRKKHLRFFEFIENEIEKQKLRVNGLTGGQTWQKYEGTYKKLKEYAAYYDLEELQYFDIDDEFKERFVIWLETGRKNKMGEIVKISRNTLSKEIETVKTFLKRSRKYHSNNYYLDPEFRVGRVKTDKHYPTLEELRYLYNYSFEKESHQKVIDLYLISAFGGGLRISDVLSLSKDCETTYNGEEVLHVFTFKGRNTKEDNEVVIPFTPQLRSLIDKYNWNLPEFSENYINKTLKVIFKLAGLNRKKLIKSGIKGESPVAQELHEKIHFHTARYAYIDYMINDFEVSAEKLQKITGQSLQVLLAYERGDKKKNATKVAAKVNDKLRGLHVVQKVS
jgi:hypothetical protein